MAGVKAPQPARNVNRHPWLDDEKKPRDARLIALEVPDPIREALGRLVFQPAGKIVKRGADGRFYVFEGENAISPPFTTEVLTGLLLIHLLKPAPHDPNEAVADQEFLVKQPAWRMYIPDPNRRQTRVKKESHA